MGNETLAQNMNTQETNIGNTWNHIDMFDIFDDGKYLWFTTVDYNALFKMNKYTFCAEYAGSFPDEDLYGYRLYTSINERDGKLFFTPCSAHEIGVYDMKNERFSKIDIGIPRNVNDISDAKYSKKFISSFISNNILILIPCCYNRVVLYDIATGKVLFRNDLFEYFYAKYHNYTVSSDLQFYLCWFAGKISEEVIAFHLHWNKNIVIFYNLKTGEFREQIIGGTDSVLSLIECDIENIYLYNVNADTLIKWEKATGKCVKCRIAAQLPEFHPCGLNGSFLNMRVFGGKLYLIPSITNIAVKVDIKTMTAAAVDTLSSECLIPHGSSAYFWPCRVFDDKLYLMGNRSKELIVLTKNEEIQRVRIKVPEGLEDVIAEKHLEDEMQNHHCFVSEEHIPSSRFLKILGNLQTARGQNASNNIGKTIYQTI